MLPTIDRDDRSLGDVLYELLGDLQQHQIDETR